MEKLLKKLYNEELLFVGNKILLTIFVIIISLVVLKFISNLLKKGSEKHLIPESIGKLTYNALKISIFVVAFLVWLHNMGISVTSLWAIISTLFAMFAVGFVAFWSVISNILCTILLDLTKPFRVGDTIEIVEYSTSKDSLKICGKVVQITMMFSILEEKSNKSLLYIPNNVFFQKIIRKLNNYEIE